MRNIFPLLALAFAPAVIVQAKPAYEFESTLVHSDLPLYTFAWDELWPRGLDDPDIIAGCGSRVRFGDWQFTPNPLDRYGNPSWFRFANYGMFHCAAHVRAADERSELEEADFAYGFFAKVGNGRRDRENWELWVWQEGFMPGSKYLLLARRPGEDIIEQFEILQRRCPDSNLLKGDDFDIWSTDYCKINSRREMLAFARTMLREPFFGRLTLVTGADDEGPPDSSGGPSGNSD